MLGWEIFIMRRPTQGGPTESERERLLGSWVTGLGGTDWLTKLAETGGAKDLGGNGYPLAYEVKVGTLVRVLAEGPPKHGGPLVIDDDYVQQPGHVVRVQIDLERLRSLDNDEILLVEAWDQS